MIALRPVISVAARLLVLAPATLFCFGLATPAAAQHTMDPYNIVGEYNNQYQPYFYPSYPNSGSLFPNQDRVQERAGNRSANQFRQYLDGIEESDLGDSETRRGSSRFMGGAGTPYYKANRQYDKQFGRVYQPNRMADQDFDRQQKQSSDKYFKAMAEKDPKKRAQLLRDYNMDSLRTARRLSGGRNALPFERGKERDRFAAPEESEEPGLEPAPSERLNRESPTPRSQPSRTPKASDRLTPLPGLPRTSGARGSAGLTPRSTFGSGRLGESTLGSPRSYSSGTSRVRRPSAGISGSDTLTTGREDTTDALSNPRGLGSQPRTVDSILNSRPGTTTARSSAEEILGRATRATSAVVPDVIPAATSESSSTTAPDSEPVRKPKE